jgi:PAS domain S-box-containing protein
LFDITVQTGKRAAQPLERSWIEQDATVAGHQPIMQHQFLRIAIIIAVLAIATIDFTTPSTVMLALLFKLPLALCALQTSTRLLFGTSAVAISSTLATGVWGPNLAGPHLAMPDNIINRGLLAATLVIFTGFIFLAIRHNKLSADNAVRLQAAQDELAASNKELEARYTRATNEAAERERAAAQIEQSERRYRGLLEAAPDAMIVSDKDGVILLVNAETERLFGYQRSELVGQSVDILVPERFRGHHHSHRSGYTAQPRTRTMGEGRKLSGLRKDGSEFPVEISLSPMEYPDGILVTTAIRDITARVEADKALRETEERHRMAVEVAEIGAWSLNIVSGEISWSDEFRRLYGFAPGDHIDREVLAARINADDLARINQAVEATIEGGAPYEVEYRITQPDGAERWIASRGRLHRAADGTPLDMQGVIMDITERRQIETLKLQREAELQRSEALARSNEELQQFAYIAAHDLQEPLRMVASYTQLLGQRYKGKLDSDADDFIEFAVDGARRMQALIADLLAYCRVETAGKAPVEVSSREAFDEAVRNLEGAIADNDAQIVCDDLPRVMADRTQLVQLFQNLVGNAIKYRTAERPEIHVSAKRENPNEWIFSIRDNGIGIDPKYAERIFLMFQRLHSREEFSGTGIGLTLCKKIAERHGGRIWVEANTGPGSTFHVAIPERVVH